MNDTFRVAVSINGISVRLTHSRWTHIIESHDYMAGYLDAVIETVEDPDIVVRGWTDEQIALKSVATTLLSPGELFPSGPHFRGADLQNQIPGKYLVVVYKEDYNGFVITAFMTSKPEKITKRGILWQK